MYKLAEYLVNAYVEGLIDGYLEKMADIIVTPEGQAIPGGPIVPYREHPIVEAKVPPASVARAEVPLDEITKRDILIQGLTGELGKETKRRKTTQKLLNAIKEKYTKSEGELRALQEAIEKTPLKLLWEKHPYLIGGLGAGLPALGALGGALGYGLYDYLND